MAEVSMQSGEDGEQTAREGGEGPGLPQPGPQAAALQTAGHVRAESLEP